MPLGLQKDLSVDQLFFKCGLQTSGVLGNPYKGSVQKVKTTLRTLLAFTHCIDMWTNNAKAMVGKSAGALA